MFNKGFADLRLNQKNGEQEGIIWPAFSDMMTNITMIFLLTMVVLIISNWDLLKKLQDSLIAEKKLEKAAADSASENQQLTMKLSDRESQLSYLQMQIINLQTDIDQLQKNMLSKDNEIQDLQTKYNAELANLEVQKQEAEVKLQESTLRIDQLSKDLDVSENSRTNLQANLNSLEKAMAELNNQVKDLKLANIGYRESLSKYSQDKIEQEQAYADLKKKYDRLVRPARSSKDKIMVEIIYHKIQGGVQIHLKGPQYAKHTVVSNQVLHDYLNNLKEKYPRKLYLKIAFPDGNIVSHSEAWDFTQELLSRYDYYYQEE